MGPVFLNGGESPAVWTWFNNPRGLRVDNYTLYGAVSVEGSVLATTYNHTAGITSTVSLHSPFSVDDHVNPAFLVRASDSRIMAFWSAHGTTAHYYCSVSVGTNDPRSFVPATDIGAQLGGTAYTYAMPIQLTGEENDPIYLFYRDYRPVWWAQSTDDGVNWTPSQLIVNGTERPYIHVVQNGTTRIDIVMSTGHPAAVVSSLYHGYYEGGNWYQSDGTLIGGIEDAPFAPTDFTLVYDGTVTEAWSWDIAIDGTGAPVIVFATFPTPASDHRYNYARWTGEAWTVTEICTAGGPLYAAETYYSGGVCLDHANPSIVYASRQVDSVYHIYKEVTADNGANWTETLLTNNSNNSFRPFVINGHDGTKQVAYFYGTYNTYTDYNTQTALIDG